jgi:PAS domain S-box-containing protein
MVGTHTDITLQKQLETDLKESERVIRESQKVAGIGTYTLNFQSGIWKSSEVLDTIFGIEVDFEHSIDGWVEIIHPEWRETMMNYFFNEVRIDRKEFDKVYRIRRVNDQVSRWVHGLGRLEFDETGDLKQMIGTIQDITERKEAQDALLQNQRILTLFVEYAPAAIAMFDTKMCYMAVSNRFIADYQLAGVELIGKSHYEIFPNIPERWKEVHRECLRGAVRIKEEDEYFNTNGTKEWIKWEVRPWFEADNEIGGLLLFTELITEHKNIIRALEESEERFRMIVESAPVGIAINDLAGNIVYLNKYLIELLGYTLDDVSTLDKWMKLAYPDEDLRNEVVEKWKVAIELAAKGESLPLIEYPVCCKDGTVKQIDFRPAISDNLIYIILTDLSEKHAAQEELRRIEWMLSKKEEQSGIEKPTQQFAYGDLTLLNKNGLIRESVGDEVLKDIVNDYLSLLETSSAIYEKSGDYALGIFSSGWCRYMDEASRKLCETDDNSKALTCGKWHCHESCWKEASLKAIQSNAPVDVECSGGIRLYALPIWANNEIIGAINFGYGNPPTDMQKLTELADKYNVPITELRKKAAMYETRPPYIIDSAKERLQASANLIGEIVTRKISEQKIIELNESLEITVAEKTGELIERIKELERFHEATIDREFRIKELRDEIELLRKTKN